MTDFVDGEAIGTVKRFYLPLVFFFSRAPTRPTSKPRQLSALQLLSIQKHFP